MGRRWIVQVDTVIGDTSMTLGGAKEIRSRYLGVGHHVGPNAGKLEAVTIGFAKLFETKREALTAAKDAGFDGPDIEAMRKWW